MGWMFSLALFVAWIFNPDMSVLLVASGLFAIAGSIGFKDFYKK